MISDNYLYCTPVQKLPNQNRYVTLSGAKSLGQQDEDSVLEPAKPSPSSPMGEKLCAPQTKHGLGNSTTPSYRKEANTMPSPFGEGQTDTPINRHNQGEVALHPQSHFGA